MLNFKFFFILFDLIKFYYKLHLNKFNEDFMMLLYFLSDHNDLKSHFHI
jgi:hypothetical protein